MLSCWPPQTRTFSIHWDGLQPSVKRLGWESAPPNPRPWSSVGKGWLVHYRLVECCYLKWRSSSIWGSCSRVRIQATEMSFLRRVAGRSLRDRVRSSVTREELRVEPLLLHIERGQLRWLGHLFRMPPGRLPWKVFQARPTGRRPRGRPRTRWRDYVSRLAWERLGVPLKSWRKWLGRGKSGHLCLDCCPRDPAPDKRKKMDGWTIVNSHY